MEDQNQELQEEQQLEQDSVKHPLCCCCFNNSMKRRSASSTEHRASKKVFRETLNGFSTILFPHNTNPLSHHAATPFHSPEDHANTVARASSLSPHSLIKGYVCDPTPNSPSRTFSPSSQLGTDKGVILTREEASDSMRMRRMKDCLREMRKWWDEGMRHEDEEEDEPEGAEVHKVLSKDKCEGGEEEAVSLKWADKCLSICFKCPCSKGYQILLSGNSCYYKLV